ncbi:hypothetical protein [Limnoglobus roseus]|nr:hypothetical protein [Limnoglobus roseus]
MVRFKHEATQASGHSVDIGVHGTSEVTWIEAHPYSLYEPFMVIEAKRLPAPSNDREREYVSGPNEKDAKVTGGIQRFKLGLHGGGVDSAAMVGYVEAHSEQYWRDKINAWITALVGIKCHDGATWAASEVLQEFSRDELSGVVSATSIHGRHGSSRSDEISIHHLFINMTSARASEKAACQKS